MKVKLLLPLFILGVFFLTACQDSGTSACSTAVQIESDEFSSEDQGLVMTEPEEEAVSEEVSADIDDEFEEAVEDVQ